MAAGPDDIRGLIHSQGARIPHLPRSAAYSLPLFVLLSFLTRGVRGFWARPQECSGALSRAASVGDFLAQLQSAKVVRCDAAALRLLGLSLAGWNAVVSAGLAGLAVAGLRLKP
jgi:disulfide bond formation protein DsbB